MNEMSLPCASVSDRVVSGGTLIARVTYVCARENAYPAVQSLEPRQFSDIAYCHDLEGRYDYAYLIKVPASQMTVHARSI